ncbi:hypothetical protein [Salininema proteolyticum]|uniref:Uncharacterized protein n=1 Tax=Salininema proteolyticum TaxID=1607685 RepID=A0ABV8TTC9_9ACTN
MAERKFDPDAVARYRDFLIYWLDELEADGGPIDTMKNGALKNAPAFGTTTEGLAATEKYGTSHATMWGNLQSLRQSLFGLIQALNKAIENQETTEEYNVDDFSNAYADLEGNYEDLGGS